MWRVILEHAAPILGALGAGGWVGAWLKSRSSAPAEMRQADASVTTATAALVGAMNGHWEGLNGALTARLESVETQVAECRREHEECRGELAATNGRVSALEGELAEARGEIARLTAPG